MNKVEARARAKAWSERRKTIGVVSSSSHMICTTTPTKSKQMNIVEARARAKAYFTQTASPPAKSKSSNVSSTKQQKRRTSAASYTKTQGFDERCTPVQGRRPTRKTYDMDIDEEEEMIIRRKEVSKAERRRLARENAAKWAAKSFSPPAVVKQSTMNSESSRLDTGRKRTERRISWLEEDEAYFTSNEDDDDEDEEREEQMWVTRRSNRRMGRRSM
mmetsp:Transcript_836/g.1265  ORF Transcript_836/g.1265 Transcript_836/m.1265 type:complete len:217 (+) Transcript_836:140-790(+)